jgi:hypothetical protein
MVVNLPTYLTNFKTKKNTTPHHIKFTYENGIYMCYVICHWIFRILQLIKMLDTYMIVVPLPILTGVCWILIYFEDSISTNEIIFQTYSIILFYFWKKNLILFFLREIFNIFENNIISCQTSPSNTTLESELVNCSHGKKHTIEILANKKNLRNLTWK